LTVVGEGRGLDKAYVDSVGQGRVWIGERALELRLVDKLGDLDAAVAAAAARANLQEYDVVDMIERKTPFEMLLGNMSSRISEVAGFGKSRKASTLDKLVGEAKEQFEFLGEFNDPNAAYARCIACE